LPRDVNIVRLVVTRWKTRAEKKRKAKYRRIAAERPAVLVYTRPGCEDSPAPLLPPFTDPPRHIGVARREKERDGER